MFHTPTSAATSHVVPLGDADQKDADQQPPAVNIVTSYHPFSVDSEEHLCGAPTITENNVTDVTSINRSFCNIDPTNDRVGATSV